MVLRELAARDVDALYGIFSDEEVTRYTAFRRMESRADAEALLDEIHRFRDAGTLFQWGVERAGHGEDGTGDAHPVIGTCTLAEIDAEHSRAELGFMLARAEWGQGLATDAVRTVLAHAFEDLGLHRVEADIDPRNHGSIRVVTRLGFRREGLLRERWRAGEEWQSSEMYGLLENEWMGQG